MGIGRVQALIRRAGIGVIGVGEQLEFDPSDVGLRRSEVGGLFVTNGGATAPGHIQAEYFQTVSSDGLTEGPRLFHGGANILQLRRADNVASGQTFKVFSTIDVDNFIRFQGISGGVLELASTVNVQWCAADAVGGAVDLRLRRSGVSEGTLDDGAAGAAKLVVTGEVEIDGDLNHDGTNVGFYGTAPAAQSAGYTRNAVVVEDRTLLASASATILNNNNVLAAMIADFQAVGLLG